MHRGRVAVMRIAAPSAGQILDLGRFWVGGGATDCGSRDDGCCLEVHACISRSVLKRSGHQHKCHLHMSHIHDLASSSAFFIRAVVSFKRPRTKPAAQFAWTLGMVVRAGRGVCKAARNSPGLWLEAARKGTHVVPYTYVSCVHTYMHTCKHTGHSLTALRVGAGRSCS